MCEGSIGEVVSEKKLFEIVDRLSFLIEARVFGIIYNSSLLILQLR